MEFEKVVNTWSDQPEKALDMIIEILEGYRGLVLDDTGILAIRDRASIIDAYLNHCNCWDCHPESYEGAQVSCPVHGAVRAFNNACKDLEDLRARVDDARDRASKASSTAWSAIERQVHSRYVIQFTQVLNRPNSRKETT